MRSLYFESTCARSCLQKGVRLGQILAVGAFALVEIRHGVQAESVDAEIEPEVDDVQDRLADVRTVEVEIRLMRVEAMPVVGFGHRIPGPVGGFEILEDDARVLILVGGVAPHVEVAPAGSGGGAARALEPGMLVGGVIEHHFGEDADAAAMRLLQKVLEIAQRAIGGMDIVVVGDVVAVVAPGRREERQQPDGGDAQVLQVIELFGETAKVAHAVVVAVVEGAHVDFVDDRVLVPQRIGIRDRRRVVGRHLFSV